MEERVQIAIEKVTGTARQFANSPLCYRTELGLASRCTLDQLQESSEADLVRLATVVFVADHGADSAVGNSVDRSLRRCGPNPPLEKVRSPS